MSISGDGSHERIQAIADIVGGMATVSGEYVSDVQQRFRSGSASLWHAATFVMISGHADAIRNAALATGDIAQYRRNVSVFEIADAPMDDYGSVLQIALTAGGMNLALARFRDEVIGDERTAESVRLAEVANDILVQAYADHVGVDDEDSPWQ